MDDAKPFRQINISSPYPIILWLATSLERWKVGNLIDLGSSRCVVSSRDAGPCPDSEADWQNCTDGNRAGKIIEPSWGHWDRKFINLTTELNSTLLNSGVEFVIWMSNLNSRIPHPNSKIRYLNSTESNLAPLSNL